MNKACDRANHRDLHQPAHTLQYNRIRFLIRRQQCVEQCHEEVRQSNKSAGDEARLVETTQSCPTKPSLDGAEQSSGSAQAQQQYRTQPLQAQRRLPEHFSVSATHHHQFSLSPRSPPQISNHVFKTGNGRRSRNRM